MKKRIILVDDDRNITTSVSMVLEAEGYNVATYNDGEAGLNGISSSNPDLVILDIKMPRMSGTEVLASLREDNQELPVIFLTSKDDEQDELLGLRMGADDYITKPFSQTLLIQRIETLLRRADLVTNANTKNTPKAEKITAGDLTLDTERYLCIWKDTQINLTVTEFLLLLTLAENPGHVKSREQLIETAYGETIYVDDRTIDSHIKRVRKKFKKIDDDFDHIETLYGVGYRYKDGA